MLVRSLAVCGGMVFGGENPALVLLVESNGTRNRLGFTAGPDVPIVDLDLFRQIVAEESGHSERLFVWERKALRQMQQLLGDVIANNTAIVELLKDPVFIDLLAGFHGKND